MREWQNRDKYITAEMSLLAADLLPHRGGRERKEVGKIIIPDSSVSPIVLNRQKLAEEISGPKV